MGVAAEVYVCRRIADETGGTYGVALNEGHLEQLLLAHSPPPAATNAQAKAELVGRGAQGEGIPCWLSEGRGHDDRGCGWGGARQASSGGAGT